ncbi:hypothetical protein GS429_04210 [Natronorubrum sp. JWXQ-INN-674]|uniref:DUF3267 domain-containing protein n=1 Tax=Natronorubrum halalkaliphilum TaxID=2691917 RepID=A0A6B0VL37_9EURY|nr:hypothetical protein [Natronorubrum halalkaliphilum]MXV61279.1 hypothetical protein [Natronorubrum halalkaliphilum]
MIGTDVAVAGCALALTVAVGLVAHECAHALVLRLARVDHTISYFPDRTDGIVGLLASCPWAVVRPHLTGREPTWVLRVAALSPLLLAVPVLGAGMSGAVTTETPIVTAIAIGWLACSIPSPQDFSVVFYAHRVLELETTPESNAAAPASRAD